MAKATATVIVNSPVPYVYKFLLDGRNNKLWRPTVADISIKNVGEANDYQIGVGTIFEQGIKTPNGMRIGADYRISECCENEKISFEVLTGPYSAVGFFYIERVEQGTKVTFGMEAPDESTIGNDVTAHLQRVVDAIKNLKDFMG